MRHPGTMYGAAVLSLLIHAGTANAESERQACARSLLERSAGENLTYRVDWKGFSLDSTRRVKRLEDGAWLAANNSSLLFMAIEESSRFRLVDGQVVSRTYDYRRKGLSKKQNLKLEFSPGEGYSAFSPRGDGEIAHATPLYDLLNHQLQLRIDLACSAPRAEYRYDIARRSRVSEYRYRRVGEERVQTPVGELTAVRLERGEPGDKFSQVWLAPELGYLIVKLVYQEEDDDKAELVLVKKPGAGG